MTHFHFYIDVEEILPGAVVALEESEFHHAKDVLRIGLGESVTLINGRGLVATGMVEVFERRRCLLRILSSERKTHPPPVCLGLSLLRPNHLDIAIEKGTEVGVDLFVLFPAERSELKGVSSSLERRLEALLTAATKQSGRLFRPRIRMASSLSEALNLLSPPVLWADLSSDAVSLPSGLATISSPKPPSLLIGPESGWSDKERSLFLAYGPPILLHENVLRAETAAIVGAYELCQYRYARNGS